MPTPPRRIPQFEVNFVMRCTVGDQMTDIILGKDGRGTVRLIVKPGCAPALAGLFALAGHAAGKATLDIDSPATLGRK